MPELQRKEAALKVPLAASGSRRPAAEKDSGQPAAERESRRPAAERVRRLIADDIVAGRLQPGTRLEEQALADRFAVSRTPVREALRQLGAAGLVEVRPRKGVVVTETDPQALTELFEALASVEYLLARLAAQRMTAVERLRLEEIHEAAAAAQEGGDRERYAALNHDFHGLIYAGARNRPLHGIAEGLRLRLLPFRSASFRAGDRMTSSLREHAAIVEAIRREDAEAAGLALRAHIDASSANALRFYLLGRAALEARRSRPEPVDMGA